MPLSTEPEMKPSPPKSRNKLWLFAPLLCVVVAFLLFWLSGATKENLVEQEKPTEPSVHVVLAPEKPLPPQRPIPKIVKKDCWEECDGGIFDCARHYAGGFVEVKNEGAAGNIVIRENPDRMERRVDHPW